MMFTNTLSLCKCVNNLCDDKFFVVDNAGMTSYLVATVSQLSVDEICFTGQNQ